MSRWELLRESLLKGKRRSNHEASIHAFSGHQLIPKKKVVWAGFSLLINIDQVRESDAWVRRIVDGFHTMDTCELKVVFQSEESELDWTHRIVNALKNCNDISFEIISSDTVGSGVQHSVVARHKVYAPLYKSCAFFEYSLPNERKLFSREIPEDRKITAKDLLSNQLFGVDNTGNICTWPSEAILLHLLLTSPRLQELIAGKVVLEIGGGQTGLAGLGLAVCSLAKEVILTDGHPDCVRNQQVCVEACRSRGVLLPHSLVETRLLEWSAGLQQLPAGSIDVVIGSDCLFFRDFHDSLIALLAHTITPNGRIVLLQPMRSGTMDLFLDKARSFFDCEVTRDYLPELSQQRDDYQATKPDYDVDRHYPLLCVLRPKAAA